MSNLRPLRTHGRYEYSPITQRPDYSWPEGRRLAVYVGFNVEHFEFGQGLAQSSRRPASPTCSTSRGATTATAWACGAASTSSTS